MKSARVVYGGLIVFVAVACGILYVNRPQEPAYSREMMEEQQVRELIVMHSDQLDAWEQVSPDYYERNLVIQGLRDKLLAEYRRHDKLYVRNRSKH